MAGQERSEEMYFAGYSLSRLSVATGGAPPSFLGVKRWKAAYERFHDAIGDGREPSTFSNSLKNVRDAFDAFMEGSVRTGWRSADGNPPALSGRLALMLDAWADKTDNEVEAEARALLEGSELASLDVEGSSMTEGGKKVAHSRRAERNPKARAAAIAHHGLKCAACGFDFEATYGELGEGFIEVHHLMPLGEHGKRETDPKKDLRPVCSNCHRMIHRRRGVCLTVEELRAHLESANSAK